MIKSCEICGREFVAQRCTARFCSEACKKRHQRGYVYKGELRPPMPNVKMTDDEVLDIIHRAHNIASDMSRASLMTSAPLCISLKKVAKKIEGALRGENL